MTLSNCGESIIEFGLCEVRPSPLEGWLNHSLTFSSSKGNTFMSCVIQRICLLGWDLFQSCHTCTLGTASKFSSYDHLTAFVMHHMPAHLLLISYLGFPLYLPDCFFTAKTLKPFLLPANLFSRSQNLLLMSSCCLLPDSTGLSVADFKPEH